ncbi:MAG: hypothetical protein MI922_19535, partial [Bacteroidales bacterium]|nr:hypothetical protein [Bacteroidales bacterium]
MNKIISIIILLVAFAATQVYGQLLRSINYNPRLINSEIPQRNTLKSAKALSLPFFDDFSYYHRTPYPDPNKWMDNGAFINSTFADSVISVGVATLDAINAYGNVYAQNDSYTPSDTLTSVQIDASTATDSVYLSFWYQGGGRADWPEEKDYLILDFFNATTGNWDSVWAIEGFRDSSFTQQIVNV